MCHFAELHRNQRFQPHPPPPTPRKRKHDKNGPNRKLTTGPSVMLHKLIFGPSIKCVANVFKSYIFWIFASHIFV